MNKGVILFLAALALTACSQTKKSINEKSNGVLVQLNGGDQESLEKMFSNHKVSVVDLDEGIFQIQGARVDEVKALLPHSHIEDDKILNVLHPDLESRDQGILKRADAIEVYIKLGCHREGSLPKAEIALKSATQFVAPLVVKRNSPDIVLSAALSRPPVETGSDVGAWDPAKDFLNDPLNATSFATSQAHKLDYHWIVQAPPGSRTTKYTNTVDLSITPDQYGGYTALLLVQDTDTGACDFMGAVIGATENKTYRGKTNTVQRTPDTDVFHHLNIVKATQAWKTTKGEGVVVAVIDTGVNYNHADLADNLFINAGETAGNGIDDDKNGLIDDVHGYDFALNDNLPFDDESHGSHVSGLVAGKNIGVAPGAVILPVKALLPTGSATTASIVAAVYYAVKMKADVINMSLGGEGDASPLILGAIRKAQQAGILIVAASGNSSDDLDVVPSHLTNKDGSNVLAIAATDENNNLTDYSCFGKTTVDLAAPGGSDLRPIMSANTWFEQTPYVGFSGTSMASPVAAGVAALVKSANPDLSAEELKDLLMKTGTVSSNLDGKLVAAKVINAEAALKSLNLPVLASH